MSFCTLTNLKKSLTKLNIWNMPGQRSQHRDYGLGEWNRIPARQELFFLSPCLHLSTHALKLLTHVYRNTSLGDKWMEA